MFILPNLWGLFLLTYRLGVQSLTFSICRHWNSNWSNSHSHCSAGSNKIQSFLDASHKNIFKTWTLKDMWLSIFLVNIVKSVYTWRYGPWAHHFENECNMRRYDNVAIIASDTCISFMFRLADCWCFLSTGYQVSNIFWNCQF